MPDRTGGGKAVVFDVDLKGDDEIAAAAEMLEIPADAIHKMSHFARQVLMNAECHELTRVQLVSVVLSVVGHLVKQDGGPREQAHAYMGLCNVLLSSIGLSGGDDDVRMAASDPTIVH